MQTGLNVNQIPHTSPLKSINTMERFEDKYFLDFQKLDDFIYVLKAELDPDPFHLHTSFNSVESLYFDSPDLLCFYDHICNKTSRFKVRLRRYGPNGNFPSNTNSHLEIKEKIEKYTKKTRFCIDSTNYNQLLNQELIKPSHLLFSLNPKIDALKLLNKIAQTNEIFDTLQLSPSELLTYRRKAFEGDDIRVTLDWNIVWKPMRATLPSLENKSINSEETGDIGDYFAIYNWLKPCIVEIKHQGVIPAWLKNSLGKLEVKEVKFSKYCYAVSMNSI